MYNYKEAITKDVLDFIKEHYTEEDLKEIDRDTLAENLNDDCWTCDYVTGNASGSYTFNSNTAREYVMEDGEQYVEDLISEYCMDAETVAKHMFDWEYWDVSIRCFLLGECIESALDELEIE